MAPFSAAENIQQQLLFLVSQRASCTAAAMAGMRGSSDVSDVAGAAALSGSAPAAAGQTRAASDLALAQDHLRCLIGFIQRYGFKNVSGVYSASFRGMFLPVHII